MVHGTPSVGNTEPGYILAAQSHRPTVNAYEWDKVNLCTAFTIVLHNDGGVDAPTGKFNVQMLNAGGSTYAEDHEERHVCHWRRRKWELIRLGGKVTVFHVLKGWDINAVFLLRLPLGAYSECSLPISRQ